MKRGRCEGLRVKRGHGGKGGRRGKVWREGVWKEKCGGRACGVRRGLQICVIKNGGLHENLS